MNLYDKLHRLLTTPTKKAPHRRSIRRNYSLAALKRLCDHQSEILAQRRQHQHITPLPDSLQLFTKRSAHYLQFHISVYSVYSVVPAKTTPPLPLCSSALHPPTLHFVYSVYFVVQKKKPLVTKH